MSEISVWWWCRLRWAVYAIACTWCNDWWQAAQVVSCVVICLLCTWCNDRWQAAQVVSCIVICLLLIYFCWLYRAVIHQSCNFFLFSACLDLHWTLFEAFIVSQLIVITWWQFIVSSLNKTNILLNCGSQLPQFNCSRLCPVCASTSAFDTCGTGTAGSTACFSNQAFSFTS